MRPLITAAAVVLALAALSIDAGAQVACIEPGPTILTDPAGDATTAAQEHDVLSLSISQPTTLGADLFVFTIKMAGLAAPTPDTTWPVVFTTPDFNTRFVRMSTDAAGVVTFASGFGTNPSPTADPGTPADPASSFSADGTIRIVVPGSDIGDPTPGQTITSFLTRIRVEASVIGALTPDNMPDSLVPSGSYTVVTCAVPTTRVSVGQVKNAYREH